MSLNVALNTAVSSLLIIETQLAVTSSNIANADSATYTRKSVDVTTQTAGGTLGVTSNGITSSTDTYLLKSIAEASSESNYASTYSSYLSSLETAFGTISSSDDNGTSLTSMLSDLTTALDELATTPETESLATQVVSDLEDITAMLKETSNTIQNLREQADQEIETTVDQINSLLSEIDDLNDQIIVADATGESTADLEDVRTEAIQELAALMDITYYTDSDGSVKIFTSSGQTLLDTAVHQVSYSSASTVTSDMSYEDGDFEGITVNGVDITESISSGTLGALIELRDETLTAAQDELDTLASALIDTVNAVYNQSSSSSITNSLTSTETVSASDTFSATGTVRIAVIASDGTVDTYQDIDLSSYSTVAEVVAALDAISGLSASIDADGQLVITADDEDSGVAINEMDSSVGDDEQGFSDYFGLNDLLTGDSATTIAVADAISDDPGTLATGTLSDSSTLAVGDDAVSSGDASIASAIYDSLTETQSFAASGSLSTIDGSISEYAAEIVSALAIEVSDAEDKATTTSETYENLVTSYSSQYGVNLDEETAKLTELQNAYSVTSQVISTIQEMYDSLISAIAS